MISLEFLSLLLLQCFGSSFFSKWLFDALKGVSTVIFLKDPKIALVCVLLESFVGTDLLQIQLLAVIKWN